MLSMTEPGLEFAEPAPVMYLGFRPPVSEHSLGGGFKLGGGFLVNRLFQHHLVADVSPKLNLLRCRSLNRARPNGLRVARKLNADRRLHLLRRDFQVGVVLRRKRVRLILCSIGANMDRRPRRITFETQTEFAEEV